MYDLLILGGDVGFTISNPIIDLGHMYGFLANKEGKTIVANRIFEMLMCEYFISKDVLSREKTYTGILQHDVVRNGAFDMELCLRKFADHYSDVYNKKDTAFLEHHGRIIFLSFLQPLINGKGFYHIESETSDYRRMDIVVDVGREQFIIELKRWDGEQHNQAAYAQLCGYLEKKRLNEGYLLTFDFRKQGNKERKAEWVETGGKRIFDVRV